MTERSTGSNARNFRTAARSELVAENIFSHFGLVVPVPRPQDSGWDLYGTLTREEHLLSWPLYHYTVQVKSESEPWVFPNADSVEWLIRHPFPLFLCVVDKP